MTAITIGTEVSRTDTGERGTVRAINGSTYEVVTREYGMVKHWPESRVYATHVSEQNR